MKIRPRALTKILAKFPRVDTGNLGLPEYANKILSTLIGVELAIDFSVCDAEYFKKYNEFLYSECPAAKDVWVVFATSGQGDFWLLKSKENFIGYYEHNDEDLRLSSIKSMNLVLEQWVVLADIIAQLETKIESDVVSAIDRLDVETALSSLNLELSNLPFGYFSTCIR